MTSDNTQLVLIIDKKNKLKAQAFIKSHNLDIDLNWIIVDELFPDLRLDSQSSFNQFMKSSVFWKSLESEELLFVFQLLNTPL